MRLFLAFIGLLLGLNLYAQETTLTVRTFTNSCGYFTNFSADIKVTLHYESLPEDAEVKLIYGLGNTEGKIDWKLISEAKAKKIARDLREVETSVVLAQRGSPNNFNSLQFVWQVKHSNGNTLYIKGNQTLMGFYEANLPSINESKCLSDAKERPAFKKLTFQSVIR
jgi:hypothetical protein